MRAWIRFLGLFAAALPAPTFASEVLPAQTCGVIVSSHVAAHEDAIGAGVIVAAGRHVLRILTAQHVAEHGADTVWIDRRPYPATIVRTFEPRDLALLETSVPAGVAGRAVVAQTGGGVTAGDSLAVWGEDDAGPLRKAATVVASDWTPPGLAQPVPYLRISCAACERGDSGGGIFDARGRLIAVLVARFVRADGTTAAIVGEHVDASLWRAPGDVADAIAPKR